MSIRDESQQFEAEKKHLLLIKNLTLCLSKRINCNSSALCYRIQQMKYTSIRLKKLFKISDLTQDLGFLVFLVT